MPAPDVPYFDTSEDCPLDVPPSSNSEMNLPIAHPGPYFQFEDRASTGDWGELPHDEFSAAIWHDVIYSSHHPDYAESRLPADRIPLLSVPQHPAWWNETPAATRSAQDVLLDTTWHEDGQYAPAYPTPFTFNDNASGSFGPSCSVMRGSSSIASRHSPAVPAEDPHGKAEPPTQSGRDRINVSVPNATSPCGVPCRWGVPCGVELHDLSPSGINHHLRNFHIGKAWDKRSRGPCEWHGRPCPAHADMFHASFGKHVATVHLGSTACQCPICGARLARRDVLARHMRHFCRGRRPKGRAQAPFAGATYS